MRILAICGSLRARSSNRAALEAAALLALPGMVVALFDGLDGLPYFNPDIEAEAPPPTVLAWRAAIGDADALLICSPEYARGIAGVLKNALDWLVGAAEFPDKPVAVINASQRAVHADAALRLTLETMSARLVSAASITLPLLGRNLDAAGIVGTSELAGPLRDALDALRRFVSAD